MHYLPDNTRFFGLYTGSTVHEVAQVAAAAESMGSAASDTAVIAKMVRVMLLAPFLIFLAFTLKHRRPAQTPSAQPLPAHGCRSGHRPASQKAPQSPWQKPAIPWFAFGFIGVVVFNSYAVLPQTVLNALIYADTAILAMAMAALGLTTRLSAIRQAGSKPLLLGLILFVWLVVGGAAINGLVTAVL